MSLGLAAPPYVESVSPVLTWGGVGFEGWRGVDGEPARFWDRNRRLSYTQSASQQSAASAHNASSSQRTQHKQQPAHTAQAAQAADPTHLLVELVLLADRALRDLVLLDAQRGVAHLHGQAVVEVKQADLVVRFGGWRVGGVEG